jgi:predicted phage tail component-like protein
MEREKRMNEPISFYFHGRWSHEFPGLIVNQVDSSILPAVQPKLQTVPGRVGAFHMGRSIGVRTESIQVTVLADTQTDLAQKKRMLANWLDTEVAQPFCYSYEPDKEYLALLSGETRLQKGITDGETTLTFVIPDPYAAGPLQKQQIDGNGIVHDTDTLREWAAGIRVGVVATDHGLELGKVGQNVAGSLQGDGFTGVFQGLQVVNGDLQLAKSGVDLQQTDTQTSDWSTYVERKNLSAVSDHLELDNLPHYTVKDHMNDYTKTGWSSSGNVIQADGHVKITSTSAAESTDVLRKLMTISFPMTIDFCYEANSNQCQINVNNGSVRFDTYLPNTGTGGRRWYRYRVINFSTAYLYELGNSTPLATTSSRATTLSARLAFYFGDADAGSASIYEVNYAFADLGIPTVATFSGQMTKQIDLSKVRNVAQSLLVYHWENRAAVTPSDHAVMVETRFSKDHGSNWSVWKSVASGASVPDIWNVSCASGSLLQYRVTLHAKDPAYSPYFHDICIDIQSGYERDGYYDSPPLSKVQHVQKGMASSMSWIVNPSPPSSIVKVFVCWAFDGIHFGEWQRVTHSGAPVPAVTVATDLSQAAFKYRVQLGTTDVSKTASVQQLDYHFTSAYQTEGERISPPLSLDVIEQIGDSVISWDTTPDESMHVEVSTQVVSQASQLDPTKWIPVQNTGAIPNLALQQNGTGKELYTRQKLTSDGSCTPILHRQFLQVGKKINRSIRYQGTASAFPVFVILCKRFIPHFKMTHHETGNRIYINRSFQVGDIIKLDGATGKIAINDLVDLSSVSLDSAFMYFMQGTNTFSTDPAGSAEIWVEWRERFK